MSFHEYINEKKDRCFLYIVMPGAAPSADENNRPCPAGGHKARPYICKCFE